MERLGAGLHYGAATMFAVGLTKSLRHETLRPAFLTSSLEPTLAGVEARLRSHTQTGEMRNVDPRGPR
jgi:hypothetical protein